MSAASETKSSGTGTGTTDKNSKNNSSSSSGSGSREKDSRAKETLRQHVVDNLGRSYMKHHAIGTGPASHIEDARAALRAYWRLSGSTNPTLLINDGTLHIASYTLLIERSLFIQPSTLIHTDSSLFINN